MERSNFTINFFHFIFSNLYFIPRFIKVFFILLCSFFLLNADLLFYVIWNMFVYF